ncbi:MAG: hypothetical protein ABI467_02310 [Kofleriaceae bacterium]
MSGPKRNPDSLNTIGVVVVGICGAVMVYVSITALQAFYMNDTSELQTMQDYGGQDTTAKSHKAEEMRNILEPQMGTPSVTIDRAMDLIILDAKLHPDHLVPAAQLGSDGQPFKPKATEVARPGSPELLVTPAAPPPAAAPAATGSGSGSANPSPPASGAVSGKKAHPAGVKTPPVPGAGGALPGGHAP